MNTTKLILQSTVIFVILGFIQACSSSGSVGPTLHSTSTGNPGYLQFDLVDAPIDAQSVNINIQSVELFVEKDNQQHRIQVASNVGFVDLLKLKNGLSQVLGLIRLPPDVILHQMRFILADGNNVVKSDGSVCPLSTPGAKHSGIKLPFNSAVSTLSDVALEMTLDFQVDQSVNIDGNGNCKLKPMIKVRSFTATPTTPTPFAPGWAPGGPPQNIQMTGASSGDFNDESDPTDPSLVLPDDLWSV